VKKQYGFLFLFYLLFSCKQEGSEPLFSLLSESQTGISFRNDLVYTEKINPYTFRNFYNGAGVAIGDINQDSLPDIFFAGNQQSNRLYLNSGELNFEDITDKAGLNSEGSWTTGVSMADVNGDGLLDIYVCKSGPMQGARRHNELFINNGDLTFTEKSKEYGLDAIGLSQHAVFFDYDKDGDLDMYLLSNSGRSVGLNDLRLGQREIRDPEGGNKLFRNEGNRFADVSQEAGIYGSAIGYGLGVTVADLNQDGWPDLYVSNDFFERDYLYLNQKNGTFREILPQAMPEISMGSMGADIADLDNDLWPDVIVTEMLPKDLARVKSKTPFEEWDKFQANQTAGYHRQFTRNTLQRHLGIHPQDSTPLFAEVGRWAGVEATDWSWGALIFDADLDGKKDIFIANGIVKDLTDFDFVDFYANNQGKIDQYRQDSILITKMIDKFPSVPQQNYFFKNKGTFQFENIAPSQGLEQLTFSTGSAYADLDNDGDLDLVVNNLNERAFVYQNNSNPGTTTNFLSLDLGNAFGAKVRLYTGGETQIQEFQPVKGYMSSVDPRLNFGVGKYSQIDSVHIDWPTGKRTVLTKIAANQVLFPKELDAKAPQTDNKTPAPYFTPTVAFTFPYLHQESEFVDFDRDRLRFWSISNEGPRASQADIDGDGRMELVIPGAKGQSTSLWKQSSSGVWSMAQTSLFDQDSLAEDVVAHFFDANGDGAADLLVGSGGIEFSDFAPSYQDRLYLNDGKGSFSRSVQQFTATPTSFILSWDGDQDGDLDLIIGQRAFPFGYGIAVGVQFWQNDGKGNFTDVSTSLGKPFDKLGMLTDGALADLDGDGKTELLLAGEWMALQVFTFDQGTWSNRTAQFGLENTRGFWKRIYVGDINGDGKTDLLAGNSGTNSRLRTSAEKPLRLAINDFDQNGSIEQILHHHENGKSIPWVLKNTLVKQIPSLKKQVLSYADYKDKALEELFPQSVWAKSLILQADWMETTLWINQGNGKMVQEALPAEVQYAPVHAISVLPRQGKSSLILLGGNESRIKPELGTQLGSYAWVLDKDVNNKWKALKPQESGLFVSGEIRDFQWIQSNNQTHLFVLRNHDKPLVFTVR
jgi:enediyne biosynthesis protein E4